MGFESGRSAGQVVAFPALPAAPGTGEARRYGPENGNDFPEGWRRAGPDSCYLRHRAKRFFRRDPNWIPNSNLSTKTGHAQAIDSRREFKWSEDVSGILLSPLCAVSTKIELSLSRILLRSCLKDRRVFLFVFGIRLVHRNAEVTSFTFVVPPTRIITMHCMISRVRS